MNSFQLYTKTNPLKLYAFVAIPGAISMIASSLWGLFDGIFVGQILGDTAFAALNLAFPFVLVNFSLSDMVGVGSSVPISIALGRKENEEAGNIFTCACILIVLTGALMGSLVYAAAPALMDMMGATGELRTAAIRYLRVYCLLAPLTTIVFAMDNYLRICGQIKGSMLLNIFMSVVILGLEWLCLVGLGMGIEGSPLAVSLGMFLCGFTALIPFFRGKMVLKFCKPRFSKKLIRQIIASGSPNFLSNIAGRVTGIVFNVILLRLGGANAVSVYGILMYTSDILQQLLYGSCDSLQPALGYNWGAGNPKRVLAIAKCCLGVGAFISIGGAALMYRFPRELSLLFMQPGQEEFLSMAITAMRLYSLTYVTRWFGFAVQSFLTALDKPLPAAILSVSNAFSLPILLIFLLWPLELNGVWLNTPITAAGVSLLAAFLLKRMQIGKYVSDQS